MGVLNPAQILVGFFGFFRGLRFLFRNGLAGHLVLPVLLSLATGLGLIAGTYYLFIFFLELLAGTFPEIEEWSRALGIVATLIALLSGSVLYVILYRFITGLLVIPFLGPLLGAIETKLLGAEIETDLKTDMRNLLLGLWVNLQVLVIGLTVWVLTLWLGPVQIVVLILVEGYFLGRGSFELLLEKASSSLKERKGLAKPHRARILGLGVASFLFLFVPIVGALFSPCAGVAGAALLYYEPD